MIEKNAPPPWRLSGESELEFTIDSALYPIETVLKSGYLFLDRVFFYAETSKDPSTIRVHIKLKDSAGDLSRLAAEFCNELVNQRVRDLVSKETATIRSLIVAQAFAETDLLETETDRTTEQKRVAGDQE